jgi:hypothetical protein
MSQSITLNVPESFMLKAGADQAFLKVFSACSFNKQDVVSILSSLDVEDQKALVTMFERNKIPLVDPLCAVLEGPMITWLTGQISGCTEVDVINAINKAPDLCSRVPEEWKWRQFDTAYVSTVKGSITLKAAVEKKAQDLMKTEEQATLKALIVMYVDLMYVSIMKSSRGWTFVLPEHKGSTEAILKKNFITGVKNISTVERLREVVSTLMPGHFKETVMYCIVGACIAKDPTWAIVWRAMTKAT